jgi:hypothetical protein
MTDQSDLHAGSTTRDEGAILPLVLVATIAFALIIGSLASYVSAQLRYGNVVEQRADRLAAADGGLRYGVEKLRMFQTLCTTAAGTGGGYTTIFPPQINGATTAVTCRRIGNPISDVQGWGAVVTGDGVPAGQPLFITKGAGGAETGNIKTFRGPVYVSDPTRLEFGAKLVLEDGDLWYSMTNCDGTLPAVDEIDSGYLSFDPSFLRGPLCADKPWSGTGGLFKAPTRSVPTTQALGAPLPYNDVIFPGCRVFYPGKYSGSIPLADDNYFVSGDYYFENVDVDLQHQSFLGGFPSGSGDTAKVSLPACEDAMIYDDATNADQRGGATFWLGGTTKFLIGTGGEMEIFRRQQNETYMSMYAVAANGVGFVPSSYSYKINPSIPWLMETKSGNTNDVAIHGLFWAPYAKMSLGNITNAATGQLVGGLVIGQLETQASNSASEFSIGIESNPVETRLLLESTATKDGQSTSIRSVVQYRPDDRVLAINSWRVSG